MTRHFSLKGNGTRNEGRVAFRSILVPKAPPAKKSEQDYGDENDSGKDFFISPQLFFVHAALLRPCMFTDNIRLTLRGITGCQESFAMPFLSSKNSLPILRIVSKLKHLSCRSQKSFVKEKLIKKQDKRNWKVVKWTILLKCQNVYRGILQEVFVQTLQEEYLLVFKKRAICLDLSDFFSLCDVHYWNF